MANINNPYLYHPHPLLKRAADELCLHIGQCPDWAPLFEQGKMLGVLLCDDGTMLRAYSGVVNGLSDPDGYFVPPIYDLAAPDDFYMQKDAEISEINRKIGEIEALADDKNPHNDELADLRQMRHEMSVALQREIFRHFDVVSADGTYRNIVQIFADAKRGLPPGGTGECAAPRLLQTALLRGLKPVALAEFWYGRSPRNIRRVHGQFYPSCSEKCSPLLSFMLGDSLADAPSVESCADEPGIIYEDERMVVVSKPAGMLSVPAKDTTLPNIEHWLKQRYPDCRLPFMLVHRLDQATSGLLLAAKDAQTHKELQLAFEQKKIRKRYVALLEGSLPSDCGVISLPICPNPDDRPRQTVDWQFGKEAVTRYNVIGRNEKITLVEFFPVTGRTHQLRLHAASPFGLDHPIVGDVLYFAKPATRLMLHAERVRFDNGSEFRTRIPLEFNDMAGLE